VEISGTYILTSLGSEPWRRVGYGAATSFESSLFGENLPPDSAPDHYTARSWALTVALIEYSNALHLQGSVTFDGTLSLHDLSLASTFTSDAVQTTRINGHLYTVRLDPPVFFAEPQPHYLPYYHFGSISGTITVDPEPLPEPSALLLTAVAAPLVGIALRRRSSGTTPPRPRPSAR
jgi:hypothetical protein